MVARNGSTQTPILQGAGMDLEPELQNAETLPFLHVGVC